MLVVLGGTKYFWHFTLVVPGGTGYVRHFHPGRTGWYSVFSEFPYWSYWTGLSISYIFIMVVLGGTEYFRLFHTGRTRLY